MKLSLDAANVNIHIPIDTKVDSSGKGDPSSDNRSLSEILTDDEALSVEDKIGEEQLVSAVKRALSRLTPREEKIMRLRFGIAEISDEERGRLIELGCSPENREEEVDNANA